MDTYGAQHAGGRTRPITTVFSLIGLSLAVEHSYTGREVQQVRMRLGDLDRDWPALDPPSSPGEVTVQTALGAPPGDKRERAIEQWAEPVWQSWAHS